DRFTRGMSYDDVHLLGSRWHGFAGYGKDEKGREWEGTIERPFYSTRVRTSEGATALVSDDEDRLFQRGDEIANFQHALRFERVFGEFLTNQNMDRTRHLTFAYEHQSDHFADVQSLFPLTLHDRVISAPLVGFQYQDLEFRKLRGVLTFDRDEDINLGWDWSVEAGPSLDALGATRDGGLGRAHVAKVSNPLPPFVWFNRLDLTGRLDGGRLNNGVSRLRSEAYWLNWWKENTATLRGQWVASKRLDPESQFLLGGDTGLRAYPVREFGGTNTALVTLENRRVVLYDYLRLVTIGWAVFADAGEVWGPQQRFRFDQVRSDVGAGIRFAPSRSTDPGLIRIDVAYALNKNDLSTRFALNIGADIRFGERRERKFDQ
ncbi:MAG: BamA/TamA family outer membrane protein, partial [Elusimicrobia bacterium]|nr:BamA/TamA family outer membrane protein [Elusimicrobiota bacterium]